VLAVVLGASIGAPTVWARTGPAPSDVEDDEPEGDDEGDEEADGGSDTAADDDRDQAAAAFREGSMFYELGQYAEAIAKFEEAWKLSPEPQLLFNLGQAQRRWFDVDPNIDHLRKSRTYFENYDKRLKSEPSYSRQEADYVQNMIEKLDAQIELEEQKAAERNRPVITGPTTAELEELEKRRLDRERKLIMAKRLNGSGIALIVAGSVSLGIGAGAAIGRLSYKLILDNSQGGTPDSPNLATVEEDTRRRNGFLTAGQVAFGALIAGVVILPIGIGLRVAGGIIERRTLGTPSRREQKAQEQEKKAAEDKPSSPPVEEPQAPKVSVEPTVGGLRIRF
jgi:tetratricopeptide (TPR) repeat protein